MKSTFEQQVARKTLRVRGAAVLLAAAALVAFAGVGDVVAQSAVEVPYVSGGVGEESISRLNAQSGDFNLKLVFALKSGAYLSGVRVGIADKTGRTLVDATANGPWFLIMLPAGDYQIVATLAGKAVAQKVSLGGARLTTLDFRWDSE